jgi:hypothetical protein
MLTQERKEHCMKVCKELLNQYEAEGDSFLYRIISGDETCHHYECESKQQSKEWRRVNSPLKKKFKALLSAGKVMCTVFWDKKWVNLLDFLEPRQTINSDFYITTLTKLNTLISRIRPEKESTFLWQHNSARPHTSLKTMENIVNLGWTVILHPLYNPDLVLPDFHLFQADDRWTAWATFS